MGAGLIINADEAVGKESPLYGATEDQFDLSAELVSISSELKDPNIPKIISSQVTLEGNPEVGTVHHLGNTHLPNFGVDRDEYILQGQRDLSIIKKVADLKVKQCFLEADRPDSEYLKDLNLNGTKCEELRRCFPDRKIPTNPSDDQVVVLARAGLSDSIKWFIPSVTLHGTNALHENRWKQVDSPYTSKEERDKIVLQEREKIVLDEVVKKLERFLANSPEVVLIYGRDHSWSPDDIPNHLLKTEVPVVIKHEYQRWNSYDKTYEFENSPSAAKQIEIIDTKIKLFDYCWKSARSGEVQLALIDKLKTSPDYWDSPSQFAQDLKDNIKQDGFAGKVAAAISDRLNNNTGPFCDLSLRDGGAQLIKSLDQEFASLTIYDEMHAFTQIELVKKAEQIEVYAFGKLITHKSQTLALPKLFKSPGSSTEDFYSSLLQYAIRDDLKQEIMVRFYGKKAPFNRK